MTENFKILADFRVAKNNDEIIELINKIENNISKNIFDNIFIDGRKIVEFLLMERHGPNHKYFSIDTAIKELTSREIIPSKVKNALFGIKIKGNEDVHITRLTDKPYAMKKDIYSVIEFVKQLFIVLKFFIKDRNKNAWLDEYDYEYKFDSDIYFPEILQKQQDINGSSIDVKPETESLKSKLKGLFELISSKYSFLIPTYQRDYTWTDENINVFLQDIKDRSIDKQTHYMGSLAISVDEKKKILRLIDGQQRITTSLLLIKVLYERYDISKTLETPEELKNIAKIISEKYCNKAGIGGALNNVKRILNDNISHEKSFQSSTAFKNYNLIRESIMSMDDDEIEEFYTTFIYYFVIAELRFKNDLGQEIQIFENLNSKGTELSQWDLIKNYIYKYIDIDFLIKREDDIEKTLNELLIIKSSKAFENKKRYDKLSNFFIFYSRIAYKLKNDRILTNKGKIHKIFSEVWPEDGQKDFTSLIDFRKSLEMASKFFEIYKMLACKEYLTSGNPLFKYRLHLENISIKDTHYPLVINAIYIAGIWKGTELESINKNHSKTLMTLLSDIDKYVTRLLVVNNVGQSLSALFDKCISNSIVKSHKLFLDSINEDGNKNTLPSFGEFQKALANKSDWQKEYALSVLRTLSQKYSSESVNRFEIVLKPTLEHIFPQKPGDNSTWFTQEGESVDIFKEKLSSRVNKIGNYLILSQPINSKVSNNSFSEKKKLYIQDNTILINGDSGKLMDLNLKSTFTFHDIDERTKQLAKLISPLYKLSNNK